MLGCVVDASIDKSSLFLHSNPDTCFICARTQTMTVIQSIPQLCKVHWVFIQDEEKHTLRTYILIVPTKLTNPTEFIE